MLAGSVTVQLRAQWGRNPLVPTTGTCVTITHRLAPISSKRVFQSTHPFRPNCDLEPFTSYNTFCISVALSWALWHSGLRGSTISMWASQGQCWHRTEALESEFPGEKPTLLLIIWYWTSNFLSLGFPKMRCNNNHHVFILYYFLGTWLISDMHCFDLILIKSLLSLFYIWQTDVYGS